MNRNISSNYIKILDNFYIDETEELNRDLCIYNENDLGGYLEGVIKCDDIKINAPSVIYGAIKSINKLNITLKIINIFSTYKEVETNILDSDILLMLNAYSMDCKLAIFLKSDAYNKICEIRKSLGD